MYWPMQCCNRGVEQSEHFSCQPDSLVAKGQSYEHSHDAAGLMDKWSKEDILAATQVPTNLLLTT